MCRCPFQTNKGLEIVVNDYKGPNLPDIPTYFSRLSSWYIPQLVLGHTPEFHELGNKWGNYENHYLMQFLRFLIFFYFI